MKDPVIETLEWYQNEVKALHKALVEKNTNVIEACMVVLDLDNGYRASVAISFLEKEKKL